MALDWSKATKVSAWNGQKDPNEKRQGRYNQTFNPDGSPGDVMFLPYDELEKQEPGVWTAKYGGTTPNASVPSNEVKQPLAPPAQTSQPAQPTGIRSINDVMASSDPSQTTEGRLNSILGSNSEYVNAAEAGAQRYANSRGLQNSSIAATAGRKAAIESALPIAQQDAGAYQQNLNTAQQGLISSRLSGQSAAQELLKQADYFKGQADLYRQQGNINMALQNDAQAADLEKQAEGYGFQSSLQAQNAKETSQLQRQGFNEDIAKSNKDFNEQTVLNAQTFNQETALQDSNRAWDLLIKQTAPAINMTELEASRAGTFSTVVAPMSQQYMQERTNIVMSPDFETARDRQSALDALDAQYRVDVGLIASALGVTLDWGDGETAEPTPTTPFTPTGEEKSISELKEMFGFDDLTLGTLHSQWSKTDKSMTFYDWLRSAGAQPK